MAKSDTWTDFMREGERAIQGCGDEGDGQKVSEEVDIKMREQLRIRKAKS